MNAIKNDLYELEKSQILNYLFNNIGKLASSEKHKNRKQIKYQLIAIANQLVSAQKRFKIEQFNFQYNDKYYSNAAKLVDNECKTIYSNSDKEEKNYKKQ